MSMSVEIRCLNAGSAGSPNNAGAVSGSSFTWCRDDALNGTTTIPTPASGPATNFSWVKSLQAYILLANGLSLSNLTVGLTGGYSFSGAKIWAITSHNQSSYLVASGPPAPTVSDNGAGPSINGVTGAAMPLIGSATPYAAGPFAADATYLNPLVEACLGIDSTCSAAGSSLTTATLRWTWVEG